MKKMSKRASDEMAACPEQSVKRSKSTKTQQISFIDLHYDYLESIFKWLNLKDLFVMAQASVRCEQLIKSFIAANYATASVIIANKISLDIHSDVLLLQEMSLIIPFMRYLGHLISKLFVQFDNKNPSECSAIEGSILKYCIGLKELRLQDSREGAFDAIEKPFQQLEVLHFVNGHLGQNISKFNKWYPKLRRLSIKHPIVSDKSCIEQTLPLLEHLDVKIVSATEKLIYEHLDMKIGTATNKFSLGNIDEAIRLNPQLRSICLDNDCKSRDLRFVNRGLKQLEALDVCIHPENFQKGCSRPIIFREVKKLVLDIYDIEVVLFDFFDRDSSNKFRFVCDKVEDLEIRCFHSRIELLDFVVKNDLKNLTFLTRNNGPNKEFLNKIASNWPNLITLTIQGNQLSADDVVQFLKECNRLQRLNISDDSHEKLKELDDKLPNEWIGAKKCCCYDFERSIIRKSYVL